MKIVVAALLLMCSVAFAGDASSPVGEPLLERPTLRSLGAYWIISGDANKNAIVQLDYRKLGDANWHAGAPLFRVEHDKHKTKENGSLVNVPENAWLFAGSALLLEPDTKYELKLTLADPDGGQASKMLSATTIAEPVAPKGALYHVIPGSGGGKGTQADPFKGIPDANRKAKPGDTFLIHAGVYQPPIHLDRSGERGTPIVWRGAGDGETIIDGNGGKRALDAVGVHDVWFENLTIRNAKYGLVTHESERIVVRRCNIHDVDFGIAATQNEKGNVNDYFIADNVITGVSHWPRSEGIEDRRGIQLTGAGHVVCYNRISNFGDAIDTMPSVRCEAIDFHNNDLSTLTDDGIEMDYSQRNTRCFENRLVNCFQGISTQPVYGGPTYVFRNVMYNICVEPFKMHNGPSGVIMVHNTSVKKGSPLIMWTNKAISNCVYRNNLFVGSADKYAMDYQGPATDCDYDYDGFAGGPFENFMKWNGQKYATLADVRQKAPIEKHAVHVEDASKLFASGVTPPADEKQLVSTTPDLRLAGGTSAIDAGQPMPGFNDGFTGKAPDLGAYELNAPLPHYGPRPQSK